MNEYGNSVIYVSLWILYPRGLKDVGTIPLCGEQFINA
jgi:hypothetical protein